MLMISQPALPEYLFIVFNSSLQINKPNLAFILISILQPEFDSEINASYHKTSLAITCE